jgi:hypothetical protein
VAIGNCERLSGQEVQVVMSSKDKKKKYYYPPTLTELTREPAIKLVADRKHCSEEEAAEFLKSFRKQAQSNPTNQKRERSS